MTRAQTQGESARELRETSAGSRPDVKEHRGSDGSPSLDRQGDLSAAGGAYTPKQQAPAADPAGYETMYRRFLTIIQAFPRLNHKGQAPKPEDFGLTDRDAAFLRVRIERDCARRL